MMSTKANNYLSKVVRRGKGGKEVFPIPCTTRYICNFEITLRHIDFRVKEVAELIAPHPVLEIKPYKEFIN